MTNRLASLVVFCLFAVSCASLAPLPTPPTSTTSTPDPLDAPWDDRSIFKGGLVPSAQPVLDQLGGASVYHLEFEIADDLFHITGKEEVRYTNCENIPLREVQFRLFPNILGGNMQISNLQVGELTTWPKYELENSLMIVQLAKPLNPRESIVIRMDFSVEVPQTVDLNYGVLAYADGVLALAHAYPMIAVYDDEGWNAEIPPQTGDVTFADASFFIVKVTAPKEVTLVTSGQRISRTESEHAQMEIVASGPARDFYLAASPEYEETSVSVGEITIRSYTKTEFRAGSQFVVETASRALKVYSERYAPYPYTELDIVATPTLALGIEYPGMIAVTAWIYEKRGGTTNDYLESTVAHEVGHQWFYNLVGDDQLDDPWLDESLTQFATLQYFTDVYGASGAQGFTNSLEFRWDRVGRSPIPIGLSVAEYDSASYSSIVYGRGPLFFVALKETMGEEPFDAFLKDYTRSFSWSIATPQALQLLAEEHCLCQLDELFDEWVYP